MIAAHCRSKLAQLRQQHRGICAAKQLLPCHNSFYTRRRPAGRHSNRGSRLAPGAAMQLGWGPASVPISLMSDSYKASHYLQYPDTTKMVAVSSRTRWNILIQYDRLPQEYSFTPQPSCIANAVFPLLSSTANFAAATTRTRRTRGLCPTASGIWWRTTSAGGGRWRTSRRQPSSTSALYGIV